MPGHLLITISTGDFERQPELGTTTQVVSVCSLGVSGIVGQKLVNIIQMGLLP